MKHLDNDSLLHVAGGKFFEKKVKYQQFSVTQRCPIKSFAPKSTQCLDICDNCIWGKETYKGSGLVNCTKQKISR